MWYKLAQNTMLDANQREQWYNTKVEQPFNDFQQLASQALNYDPQSLANSPILKQLAFYKQHFDMLNTPQNGVLIGNRTLDPNTMVHNNVNMLQDFQQKYQVVSQTFSKLSGAGTGPQIKVEPQNAAPRLDQQMGFNGPFVQGNYLYGL